MVIPFYFCWLINIQLNCQLTTPKFIHSRWLISLPILRSFNLPLAAAPDDSRFSLSFLHYFWWSWRFQMKGDLAEKRQASLQSQQYLQSVLQFWFKVTAFCVAFLILTFCFRSCQNIYFIFKMNTKFPKASTGPLEACWLDSLNILSKGRELGSYSVFVSPSLHTLPQRLPFYTTLLNSVLCWMVPFG